VLGLENIVAISFGGLVQKSWKRGDGLAAHRLEMAVAKPQASSSTNVEGGDMSRKRLCFVSYN